MGLSRQSLAVVAVAALGFGGIWRAGLAVQHYHISRAIANDPSAREIEQISAFLELGLSVILLAHAVAAAWLIRHPLRLHGVLVVATAAVTGLLMAGSFLRAPILSTPGLLPAALILGCAGAGYFSHAPWVSTYLGALAGSLTGFCVAAPSIDPISALAVTAPPIVFAWVGVALGKAIRRLRLFQSAT